MTGRSLRIANFLRSFLIDDFYTEEGKVDVAVVIAREKHEQYQRDQSEAKVVGN